MRRLRIATVASACFTASAQAGSCGGTDHAHNPKEMAVKYFKQMDTNGDDVITKLEFDASSMAKMVKSFDVLNPNERGEVEKKRFIESFVKAHSKPKNEA